MRFPHFDFYPADWRNDTHNRLLTFEERGVHVELLCLMWDQPDCALPADDDGMVARLLGVSARQWRKWRAVLLDGDHPVFLQENGRFFSKKLRKMWDKAQAKSTQATGAATRRWNREAAPHNESVSADAMRRQCDGNADAMRTQSGGNASHLSPVIGSERDTARVRENRQTVSAEALDHFCAWYPPLASLRDTLAAFPDADLGRANGDALTRAVAQGLHLDLIGHALQIAQDRQKPLAYAVSIVRDYQGRGLTTLDDLRPASPAAARASPQPLRVAPRDDTAQRAYADVGAAMTGGGDR